MPPDINPADDPQVLALTSETDKLFGMAVTYAVATPQQYEAGGEELKRVKAAQKRLDELRKSMTRPLDAAKAAVMGFFRAPEEKLASAEAGIKRAMIAYSEQQERIRREEQRRAEEIARKERERLEAQAREVARKAQEEQARLRREAAAAEAAGRAAEAAKLAAKAAAAQEKGEAKAAALESQSAAVVAPVIQRETPKVSGQSTRELWFFEVTDAALVPREYLAVDETKIRKVVGAFKGDTKIAGVRVYSEKRMASGAA